MSDAPLDLMNDEPTPTLPHLAGEFLLWLWWTSERERGHLDLGETLGEIDLWMDTRLAFRTPGEGRAAAVLTGENPSNALEARAALVGGKVVQEARLGIRREEKEFFVTLKSPNLDLAGVKLPQVVKGNGEEALYDRMFLYEEVVSILTALFARFARLRAGAEWTGEVLPGLASWLPGGGLEKKPTPEEEDGMGDG